MPPKRVVVVAAGLTERSALPGLTRHLVEEGVAVVDVRIPPARGALTPESATRIMKAAWYELEGRGQRPAKFVLLVDAGGRSPDDVLAPYRERCDQLTEIPASRLVVFAQWHLEAWFFADAESLRQHLGRDLGHVDTSRPDEIQRPKLHLRHLLGGFYTANIAGRIAAQLDARTIAGRSRSFAAFEDALRNGAPA